MPYVDGFLLPVPKKNIALYRRMARKAGKIWIEHGALEFRECAGDDLNPKGPVSFRKLVKAKPTETVFFSWIVFRSKADRARVNKKVMTDPRLQKMMQPGETPFDFKRMAYGGFRVAVDL